MEKLNSAIEEFNEMANGPFLLGIVYHWEKDEYEVTCHANELDRCTRTSDGTFFWVWDQERKGEHIGPKRKEYLKKLMKEFISNMENEHFPTAVDCFTAAEYECSEYLV